MKTLKTIIHLVLTINFCAAQNIELNSLMNKEQQLTLDSFKQELSINGINETELLNNIATAHYIYIDKGKIKAAMRDMKNNIPYNEFIEKYPETNIDSNLLVIKQHHLNYKNEAVTNYINLPAKKKYLHNITSTRTSVVLNQNLKDKWVFNYSPKNDFSDEFLMGFYFTSEFGFESLINEQPFIVYNNNLQQKGEAFFNKHNYEPSINKILSFLGKLVDVCASLFISYNNPDLLKLTLSNIIVPKMTKPIINTNY